MFSGAAAAAASSESDAAALGDMDGASVAGLDERPACQENNNSGGDGFSDISDSELLQLHDGTARGDEEKRDKQMEHEMTSPGKIDVSAETADNLLQYGMGENSLLDNVQRKRKQEPEVPLEKYHLKYVTVTDVCSQIWCEQQMVYTMEQPKPVRPEKTAAMNEGSSIHLARELEVHDLVSVAAQTREDSWAIKCLNILAMIPVLQSGNRSIKEGVLKLPCLYEKSGDQWLVDATLPSNQALLVLSSQEDDVESLDFEGVKFIFKGNLHLQLPTTAMTDGGMWMQLKSSKDV